MTYKSSNYNLFIELEDHSYILYNTLTGGMAQLDQNNYQEFIHFIEDQKELSAEFLEQLKSYQFIIDQDLDERTLIRRRMMEERFSEDSLVLTIAPTLKCNFACSYCFEQGVQDGQMDEKTIQQLMDFFDQAIKNKKRIRVLWMGGEPLLELDLIERLSKHFIQKAQEHQLEYESSIITNGYLLDEQVAKKLVQDLQITFAQVTLDGSAKMHNQKRPLKNGQPTFDQIVANIIKSARIFSRLGISINLDQENIAEASKVLDLFDRQDLKAKLDIHVSLIKDYAKNMPTGCISDEEFANINYEFKQTKLKRGFITHYELPKAKFNYCGLFIKTNHVIDPKGRIYKCGTHYGYHDKVVGDIFRSEPTDAQEQLASTYLLFDPTSDPECKNCQLLPLCMGGCYRKREQSLPTCNTSLTHLKQTIKTIIEKKLY